MMKNANLKIKVQTSVYIFILNYKELCLYHKSVENDGPVFITLQNYVLPCIQNMCRNHLQTNRI